MKGLVTVATLVAALALLLLLGASPALAQEVECYSCHTDGSQGMAGELKLLPEGHPSAVAEDGYAAALPSTGLLFVVPALGLLAAGAGAIIYRKRA